MASESFLQRIFCNSATRVAVLALALAGSVRAAPDVVSVTDTTGWTAWVNTSGVQISDTRTDQQTGQTTDDFVGDTTYAGFQQKAGTIGGVDNILFRARFDSFAGADKWGNGGNFGLGLDLNGDGDIELIMVYSEGSGNPTNRTREIYFGTPGAGANNSPSTTTWTLAGTPAASLTINTSYDLSAATDYAGFGGTQDAWMTIAVPFTTLETAIQTYATGFSTYDLTYDSKMSFIAFTSQQTNALNQDLYGGAKGSETSTTTFAALGAMTTPITASGGIPEPATYAQVGVLLLMGGYASWRRRKSKS
jgi:hypothetical protein